MDMYFMTLKEFLKHFIKLVNNEDVLAYQYVLVSNTLKSDSSMDNVCKMSILYPTARTVSGWLSDRDEEDFIERYYDELNEYRPSIVTILECAMSGDIDTIFINGVEEDKKIPYMGVIANYIYTEFGVPVYDFKAIRKGKEDFIKWNQEKVFKKVHDEFKALNAKIDLEKLSNHERNKILKTMKTKRLRKEVRFIGFSKQTVNDMNRKDLIETLNEYYGDEAYEPY